MEPEPETEENPTETVRSLKRKIRQRWLDLQSRVVGPLVIAGAIVTAMLTEGAIRAGNRWEGVVIALSGIGPAIIRFSFFDKKRKKQRADYKDALLKMAGTEDINAVGLLLEEAYHYDFALRQAIRAALMRLLPRLQTENAPALDESQRKTLTYLPFVTSEVNPNLRLAALQAIAQVGNAEALRIVKKNRNSTGEEHGTELRSPISGPRQHSIQIKINKVRRDINNTPIDYVSCFQSAVEDCIAELEARLARETAAETLLRASQSDSNNSGTLLRPAANTDSSADLLRPANDEITREEN